MGRQLRLSQGGVERRIGRQGRHLTDLAPDSKVWQVPSLTVLQAWDFVSVWMSRVLGIWTEHVVMAGSIGVELPLLDPRIEHEEPIGICAVSYESKPCRNNQAAKHHGSTPGRKPHHQDCKNERSLFSVVEASKMKCAGSPTDFCNFAQAEATSQTHDWVLKPGHKRQDVFEVTPVAADQSPKSNEWSEARKTIHLHDLIPDHPKAGTCASFDMVDELLAGHGIHDLSRELPCWEGLDASVRDAFDTWLGWESFDMSSVETLHVFTDGAHFPDNMIGAWAIACAVELRDGTWQWAGALSNPCGEDGMTGLHFCQSAFTPELLAIMRAMILALNCDCNCSIHYDCCSAARVAQGLDSSDHVLAAHAVGIHELLHRRIFATSFWYEPAHEAIALNKLADKIAKMTCHGWRGAPCCSNLDGFIADGTLKWLWLSTPETQADKQWPFVCQATGVFRYNVDTCTEAVVEHRKPRSEQREIYRDTPACSDSPLTEDVKPKTTQLNMVSYNVMTLRGKANTEAISRVFRKNRIDVAGLQETRGRSDEVVNIPCYRCFCSSGVDGQLGCQIWIALDSEWEIGTVAVLVQRPRILAVAGRWAWNPCAILSAHAPHSGNSDQTLDVWWQELATVMRVLPRGSSPIVFIDANARYRADQPQQKVPLNRNAMQLDMFLHQFGLVSTRHFNAKGEKITTWRSPRLRPDVLDYVLVPEEWVGGFVTQGQLPGHVDLTSEWDHEPLLAQLRLRPTTNKSGDHVAIDRMALKADDNKPVLADIFRQAPKCDWFVDVETHSRTLHEYLATTLREAKQRRHQPFLSEKSWVLIRTRHSCRKALRYMRMALDRQMLSSFFAAWVHNAGSRRQMPATCTGCWSWCGRMHVRRLNCARVVIKLQRACGQLRQSLAKDEALYTQTVFRQATGAGVEALATLLRSVLKQGRRFRPPRTAPVLLDDEGEMVVDANQTTAMLGQHFAAAERCFDSDEAWIQSHLQAVRARDGTVELLDEAPSFPDLVHACRRLKSGKAAGLRGIPPEAYNQVPAEAARVLYPLQLKMMASGESQRDMRRVWNIPIPKKAGLGCSAWRAVALMEPSMKAIAKSVRSKIAPFFRSSFRKGQGGALPGQLEFSQSIVRSHLRRLQQEHLSGAVLFVDGVSAFYATVRQYLFDSSWNQREPEALSELIGLLTPDEEEQARIFAVLIGPSVLEQVGTPDILRRFVASMLQGTYFVMGPEDSEVHASRTGTTPGAPLADMFFAGVFARFLRQLETALGCRDAVVKISAVHDSEMDCEAPAATWVDDVAILACDPNPAVVVGKVVTIVKHTQHALKSIGVSTNFGPNKTEAIVSFYGDGSQAAKRKWLSPGSPSIPVRLLDGHNVEVLISEQYLHLGSVAHHSGCDLPDVNRRKFLAQAIMTPVRKRLLSNPYLSSDDKRTLLCGMVLRKLLFGSGQWALNTDKEQKLMASAYMSFVRQSCRSIVGVGSAGMTDEQTCVMMQMLLPEEALMIERARTACAAVQQDEGYLCQVLARDMLWMPRVLEAFARVRDACWGDLMVPTCEHETAVFGFLRGLVGRQVQLKHKLRVFRKACLESRKHLRDRCLLRAKALEHAERCGVAVCKVEEVRQNQLVHCPACAKTFANRGPWRHTFRKCTTRART